MKPNLVLYSRSKDNIWTNKYISQNMLAAHLDFSNDAASRNISTIIKTTDWIVQETHPKKSLLDLGCGPGIYSELLTKKGYSVTGIDISEQSIKYAKKSARLNHFNIQYINSSYLDFSFQEKYDVAICIYCDFGALIPEEQKKFLKNVHSTLNDGGILIFDVFSDGLNNSKKEKKTWTYEENGSFWCKKPHFLLEETVHFKGDHVWGNRSIIITEENKIKEYIIWDTYFTQESIKRLLENNGFAVEKIERNLVGENTFTSNDVMFIKARKI